MSKVNSGIYAFWCHATHKYYVGSAVNVYYRKKQHTRELDANTSECTRLQNAWNKYGADRFTWQVLEFVLDRSELIAREQFYIDSLRSYAEGYNTAPKAGSTAGRRHSAETRAKIAAALTGKPCPKRSEAHKAAISAANKGKPKSEAHKAKLSEIAKRTDNTDRLRAMSAQANKARWNKTS